MSDRAWPVLRPAPYVFRLRAADDTVTVGVQSKTPETSAGEETMRKRILALFAGATALSLATAMPAYADYSYILSGNGKMSYTSSTNYLQGWDYKNGDNIAIHYAYTDSVCGSTGSACAPGTENGVVRITSPNAGAYEDWTLAPNKKYVLLKICNEDTGPDTCSNWKRSAA